MLTRATFGLTAILGVVQKQASQGYIFDPANLP